MSVESMSGMVGCVPMDHSEIEGGKEYLPMTSKAAKELRKIVLDREWLKSLEHYVRFRYVFFRISVVLITLS